MSSVKKVLGCLEFINVLIIILQIFTLSGVNFVVYGNGYTTGILVYCVDDNCTEKGGTDLFDPANFTVQKQGVDGLLYALVVLSILELIVNSICAVLAKFRVSGKCRKAYKVTLIGNRIFGFASYLTFLVWCGITLERYYNKFAKDLVFQLRNQTMAQNSVDEFQVIFPFGYNVLLYFICIHLHLFSVFLDAWLWSEIKKKNKKRPQLADNNYDQNRRNRGPQLADSQRPVVDETQQ